MKFHLTVCLLLASQAVAFSSSPSFVGNGRASASSKTHLDGAVQDGDTPDTLPDFKDVDDYLQYMSTVSAMPKGFATGTASGTFISTEAPGLGKLPIKGTVIHLTEGPTDNWAAVFTSNRFPGAPVKVGRKRLANGNPLQALVINNKVSNVCSGGDGEADAELVCQSVADALGLDSADSVLPSSTGVIGWKLPAKELAADVVPQAIQNLQSESVLDAAKAIMTTDRFPKVRSRTLSNGARVVGIAKGAGMIEPNMATMLAYILTDATVPKADLQRLLRAAVDESFNAMSVDGDESTSDTAVLVASNQISEDVDMAEFESALFDICKGLAADIVRNGEGTSHVMRVAITNFPGEMKQARYLGRHIVNSPLFKCAVAGNDPNTGRLAGAIGSYMGKFYPEGDVSTMSLTLGGRTIFENGKFVLDGAEDELSAHMKLAEYGDSIDYPPHQKFVEIGVDFGSAGGTTDITVLGSDLTGEYVVVNADYRS
eukprot:CAMPEP_0119547912 /NCGR_PEP_ID=MMETSP1352-20130426/1927_1 /TAXON_ID=265584 /ORGANISM="Stauroneis constricta, Strain CCMP1120" /LENGTH=484 /DNA_ID=CAMNT_0007592991 /DNA_START=76 /DNA_END=1530 /DNA_ORIENTATION=-